MNRLTPKTAHAALIATLLLTVGCSSPPTHYYVLSPLSTASFKPVGSEREITVGVGPIQLPDYLDRPQIVTRSGQNELQLAEFDRWGEPLKDNAGEELAESLSLLLPSKKVSVIPWKRRTPIDYQVVAKIIRFDRVAGGGAVLSARWSLLAGDGGKEVLSRESRYEENPAGASYADTVEAMNRALAQFSQDVAGAIQGDAANRP